MIIISHRGLDPSNKHFHWSENTLEAHSELLSRGFAIEFDIYPVNGSFVISHHDPALNKPLSGTLCTLEEILQLKGTCSPSHFLHFKGKFQDTQNTRRLIDILKNHPSSHGNSVIFDLLPTTARVLKTSLPHIMLAASSAHPFDIKRYNGAAAGTLLNLKDALIPCYDWVWLDEWDTLDEWGKTKQFYEYRVFELCREAGKKIALVTPELHATSPGLLGGESHADASSNEALEKRMKQIIALKPDAICTDYPNLIRQLRQSFEVA